MSVDRLQGRAKFTELSERPNLSDAEIENLSADPVIRDALVKLKMDVLISGWVVKASSDEVTLFCRYILSRIWVEMIMLLLDAISKGTQICEVVWDIEDLKILGKTYPASVVPKSFYGVARKGVKFLWDPEKRDLVGIKIAKPERTIELLGEKVLWYSFGATDKSWPFGRSLLDKVRPLHEMFNDAMDLLGAYVENLTMPPIIGYAPPGEMQDAETGEVLSGLQYLGNRLRELRQTGIGIFPTDLTPEGHPRWRVDFQTGPTPAGSIEIARILEVLRQFKKEAVYPASPAMPGLGGGQLPASSSAYILRELLGALNKQIVKQLVYLNWGPEEWAYIEPADQAADIGLVRDIVRSTIQFSEAERQKILKYLDWYSLLQMFGLPLSMEEERPEPAAPPGLGGLGLPPGLAGLGGLGGFPPVDFPPLPIAPPVTLPPVEAPKPEEPWRKALERLPG